MIGGGPFSGQDYALGGPDNMHTHVDGKQMDGKRQAVIMSKAFMPMGFGMDIMILFWKKPYGFISW